ncbi:MAG: Maf family protein [Oscillospiraceae bacterium]|jgi:septum formation protein|nr:Maf family protein [Oscillospiraceae bacterium]
MRYILASASPRRRELLALAGLCFDVRPPLVEERLDPAWDAAQAARSLSIQKAAAIAARFPQDCVIAAATFVEIDGAILGKPVDAADAARMLRLLSGREHRVVTGVCLRLGQARPVFSQETLVRFYPLSDSEIEAYIKTGEPMDKAGAYGIQGRGALLVEGIAGDYCNVVGLPLARLTRELREFLGG